LRQYKIQNCQEAYNFLMICLLTGFEKSFAIRGQFHQLSTYSFYARGAQMREKESQVVSLFTLSGSTSVKVEHKYLGEIEPSCQS
jgi:hypothetical protein